MNIEMKVSMSIERFMSDHLSRAVEVAAIAAYAHTGKGNKYEADKAAVEAMEEYLNTIPMRGVVYNSEGAKDKSAYLDVGHKLGLGYGPELVFSIDYIDGTKNTANDGPNAISALAASEKGGLVKAPDAYMQKLIVRPEVAKYVSIDDSPTKIAKTVAEIMDRPIETIRSFILDRDRNEKAIKEFRKVGVKIIAADGGDLMPGVLVCLPSSRIHFLYGIGGGSEGCIAAAGVKCLKGGMQSRYWFGNDKTGELKEKFIEMGGIPDKVYTENDLAPGKNILFTVAGVTDSANLKGVSEFAGGNMVETLTLTYPSREITKTRRVRTLDENKIIYHLI